MDKLLISIIIGYLLGNIQASYLLAKTLKKVDIRTLGYGNAGMSNSVESLGWKFGLMVGFVDVGKGILSILLIKYLFNIDFNPDGALLLYLNGYSVILGHIFPFHMNFKGGKGTAALIGILIGLNPIYGLIGMGILILVTLITDYVAVGTLALTLYVIGLTISYQMGLIPLLISIGGSLLSLYFHLPNYKRILSNTEGRLSRVLKKAK
ncbi:MAG: glycerol-3-phosphate acyltransferase [Ignavibacteria bacterium]|nr:glycerol-3-phosphate acyltransferase [Ignavibacteria bacterium]